MPCPSCGFVASDGYYLPCPNCMHITPRRHSTETDSPSALTAKLRDVQPSPVPQSPRISPAPAQPSPQLYRHQQDPVRKTSPVDDFGDDFGADSGYSTHTPHGPPHESSYYKNHSSNMLRPDAKSFVFGAPGATYPPSVARSAVENRSSTGVRDKDRQSSTYIPSEAPTKLGTQAAISSSDYNDHQQNHHAHHTNIANQILSLPESKDHGAFRTENNASRNDIDPTINPFSLIFRSLTPYYSPQPQSSQQPHSSHGVLSSASSHGIGDSDGNNDSMISQNSTSDPPDNVAESSLRDSSQVLDANPTNCSKPSPSHATTTAYEQQEGWEMIDQNIFYNQDASGLSNEVSALITKPDDAKSLESLDTRYSLIKKPQRFFKVGRAFMTLWSEPASSTVRDSPNVSSSSLGARIFSETRRFVVVRSGLGYSLCCPIQTYQKRGTTKQLTKLEHHAIVYTAGTEPILLPEEESPGMGYFSIVVEDKFITVDASSRLNFGKIYTVEHNIKVRNIGKISKASLPRLKDALSKSMGLDASDRETETETETEKEKSAPPVTRKAPSPLRHKTSFIQISPSQDLPENKAGSGIESSSERRTTYRRTTYRRNSIHSARDNSAASEVEISSSRSRRQSVYPVHNDRLKTNTPLRRSVVYRNDNKSRGIQREASYSGSEMVVVSAPVARSRSSSGIKSASRIAPKTTPARLQQFVIDGDGIDREVIMTDICRYLGNEALVKPVIFQNPKTGRSQAGFNITASRPPTLAQLADLRSDSKRWQEERRRRRHSGSVGEYNAWSMGQATTNIGNSKEGSFQRREPSFASSREMPLPPKSLRPTYSYNTSARVTMDTTPSGYPISRANTLQSTYGTPSANATSSEPNASSRRAMQSEYSIMNSTPFQPYPVPVENIVHPTYRTQSGNATSSEPNASSRRATQSEYSIMNSTPFQPYPVPVGNAVHPTYGTPSGNAASSGQIVFSGPTSAPVYSMSTNLSLGYAEPWSPFSPSEYRAPPRPGSSSGRGVPRESRWVTQNMDHGPPKV